eukprot:4041821-Amphidinium_carterae.1
MECLGSLFLRVPEGPQKVSQAIRISAHTCVCLLHLLGEFSATLLKSGERGSAGRSSATIMT